MKLFNTLTKTVEEFKPLNPPKVTMYICGPTVYDYTHIGHLRKYVNDDVLRRTLGYLGFEVKCVMNITDVGHLTEDCDEGEDKLEKGAKRTGKTVDEVIKFYTGFFFKSTDTLNIQRPNIVSKAIDHVPDMIELIKKLQEKGYTYETSEALYFDISKFKGYGKLSGQPLDEKLTCAREGVQTDPQKKHSADFALWFKKTGRFANHVLHWESPWGDGFPGWHIECSAMSMKYLGDTIDIHTGGVDHIPVHHENEIAQSESATGKPFVKYWVHDAFLQVDGQKMSKSLQNFYTIEDVEKHEVDPLAIRFLFLQTHYRQQMNFTWDSAKAAQEAYNRLRQFVIMLRKQTDRTVLSQEKLDKIDLYRQKFINSISIDLQMPKAVSIMWEMLKSNVPSMDKLDLLFEFDQMFGLKLNEVQEEKIPEEIRKLAQEREQARKTNDFQKSDELRKKIHEMGYAVEDAKEGFIIKKNS